VPNSLPFEGDFDWFLEGFSLYKALGTALRLKLIDFQEFLDTLGRVYDSYRASAFLGQFSLIEASRRRWTSGSSLVYDQGLLTALLFDLQLRKKTNSQQNLNTFYRALFPRYPKASSRTDANEALASLFEQIIGEDFFRQYVAEPAVIDLNTRLAEYGLRLNSSGPHRLVVSGPLSKEQRAFLHQLGYRGK
jgi:predicted metalloprotease with PDZ domain